MEIGGNQSLESIASSLIVAFQSRTGKGNQPPIPLVRKHTEINDKIHMSSSSCTFRARLATFVQSYVFHYPRS